MIQSYSDGLLPSVVVLSAAVTVQKKTRDASQDLLDGSCGQPRLAAFSLTEDNHVFITSSNIIRSGAHAKLRDQTGWCGWVTGLPGYGKSTVSNALLERLRKRGVRVQILSSDLMRRAITPEATYSIEERDMVYDAIAYVAKLLTRNNYNV